MKVEDVVIIGAGPAGIAAAIQLKRYGLEPVVFEREKIGGLLHNANLVENYPGFPDGIPGSELIKLFSAQLNRLGIKTRRQEITGVDYCDGVFEISSLQETCFSEYLIIASGTTPNQFEHLDIPENLKDKVFYEVRDLVNVSNKEIVIVGAGDAAFDYALNLAQNDNHVTILNRGNEVKSLELLVTRVKEKANIDYKDFNEITSIFVNEKGMSLHLNSPEGKVHLFADYLLGALGRKPNQVFIRDNLRFQIEELRNSGLLYLVGDVKNEIYRQTAIAVGDGVMAAMQIHHMLEETEQ
jgi:thioredoxin reductase